MTNDKDSAMPDILERLQTAIKVHTLTGAI